jgi:predicted DNA-binding transcriptional regulator AlpA
MTATTPSYEILTVDDVAELLGVKPRSIHLYIWRRTIPTPTYVGRTPTWTRDTIETWLADRPSASWRRNE